MSNISTHVLDTARGEPARGLSIALQRIDDQGGDVTLATGTTDGDGRVLGFLAHGQLTAGRYRLVFETGAYQRAHGSEAFFPRVVIEFDVREAAADFHVPLLLSPFGYSTYRGG